MQIEEILSQTLTELVRSEQAQATWHNDPVKAAAVVSRNAAAVMGASLNGQTNQIQKEAFQTIVTAIRLLKNLK